MRRFPVKHATGRQSTMQCTALSKLAVSVCLLVSIGSFSALQASEYFFRPTSIAAFQTWQPTLEFLLVNSGRTSIVVKAIAIETTDGTQGCALTANTKMILVPPRRAIIAIFECQGLIQTNRQGTYTLKVEQVPILFVRPGTVPQKDTMLLRNFTASVIVRRSNRALIQVAAINIPDQ